ncbi:MAG TPA: peptidoglycan recognition family protein [Planctomycetota bacterium]|nr:peptidoglycan recognition family protein [Planctomycetota bacterium]
MVSVLLGTLLGACSTARHNTTAPAKVQPVLTGDYILAPVRGDAELELEDLAGVPGNAAKLRRSWILLQTGKANPAMDLAAEVLYSNERTSPAEEAFARFVRAEAFVHLGQADRGRFDRQRASELALDPELRRRLQQHPDREPVANGPAAPLPQMERRSAWSPLPVVAARLDRMTPIYRLTIHHSAIPLRENSEQAAAIAIRNIQHEHMQGRGFGDIGYHFLIDPAGRVWEGRDLHWQGAHARDENNIGNVGVCLLGNFIRDRRNGQVPTDAQVNALRQLVDSLSGRYTIVPDQIWMHSHFTQTVCPGPTLATVVTHMVDELKAHRHPAPGTRLAAAE